MFESRGCDSWREAMKRIVKMKGEKRKEASSARPIDLFDSTMLHKQHPAPLLTCNVEDRRARKIRPIQGCIAGVRSSKLGKEPTERMQQYAEKKGDATDTFHPIYLANVQCIQDDCALGSITPAYFVTLPFGSAPTPLVLSIRTPSSVSTSSNPNSVSRLLRSSISFSNKDSKKPIPPKTIAI